MNELIYYAIPLFLGTIVLEALLLRGRDGLRGYEQRDTAASLAMGVGNVLIAAALKALTFGFFVLLHRFRLFDIPNEPWAWALLLVSEDFCYYWFHRASHEVRFFWAAHVNHHSSTHYNLSTALRQSWTTPLTAPLFWAPLPLLGFDPLMLLAAQAVSLLYQYWIHTELVGRLPGFELVFNSPSHHRVHHGKNAAYLDRNHGGILIVWDRLFGTFEPEREPVRYGLTTDIETFHPVKIAFHEWRAMLADVRAARTLRGRLGYLFGPPGWREDGTGKTSEDLRREAAEATRLAPAATSPAPPAAQVSRRAHA